jgi:hypothetical protein
MNTDDAISSQRFQTARRRRKTVVSAACAAKADIFACCPLFYEAA